MTVSVSFHPEAATEFHQAVLYYEAQQRGLGRRLEEMADLAFTRLEFYPEAHQKIRGPIRRCPVEAFPFAILYCFEKEDILVLAFAHHNRKPYYWLERTD